MKLTRDNSDNSEISIPFWKKRLSDYAIAIRPVATIMYIAVSDFSSIVEDSEEEGLQLLARSRKLQKYYAEQFRGTRIVEMGANTLISFHSVELAIQCALKIQRCAKTMFNHQLNIGIHMGEVNYVKNDVLGMTVNIAEDIHQKCKPGQILVSESVENCLPDYPELVELSQSASEAKTLRTYEIQQPADMVSHVWRQHDIRIHPFEQEANDYKAASGF